MKLSVGRIVGGALGLVAILALMGLFFINNAYIPVRDGKLYLSKANNTASILRERDTGIIHIKSDDRITTMYAQGFAHAQDRLWQMEKNRRVANGQLCEIFGEKALQMDKFARIIGYRKYSEITWNTPGAIPEQQK